MTASERTPPIAPALVAHHLNRARALMAERDADGLLVFRDTNILAFSGVPLGPSDRLVCGLVNRDGAVAVVLPAFEADAAGDLPGHVHVYPWHEHEDAYAKVAEAALDLGISSGRILLDGHMWIEANARLAASMNGATLERDADLIDTVRIIKSDAEIEAIRTACKDTGRIYPLVDDAIRAGQSERELRDEVLSNLRRNGFKPIGDLIQGGENAAVPHRQTGDRRFQAGDAVIVDFVCIREGYHGDMTRTFAVGEPSDETKRAYAVVREAQRAAIAVVRPGVSCESVDAAARGVIESAGLGEYFVHRLGHGIGLDIHEPPYLVRGSSQTLAAGMCVTIEPGVYVPGKFGIRIEDVVVVTDNGCEVLSGDVPTDVSVAFREEAVA